MSKDKNENELAEVLKAKIREVDTLLQQMRAQANYKKVNLILLSYLTLQKQGKKGKETELITKQ